ncbi:hypothetical protein NPIL_53531 [Nephila pilipes]|uniref:Uncharacterized protein n=1 Tax=Nephila pilipes TaxID=299642 RepID=A0A8X6TZP6_NEPPI|nr:hypothetical protein NPIL_53531 [Nephila pilipes]
MGYANQTNLQGPIGNEFHSTARKKYIFMNRFSHLSEFSPTPPLPMPSINFECLPLFLFFSSPTPDTVSVSSCGGGREKIWPASFSCLCPSIGNVFIRRRCLSAFRFGCSFLFGEFYDGEHLWGAVCKSETKRSHP